MSKIHYRADKNRKLTSDEIDANFRTCAEATLKGNSDPLTFDVGYGNVYGEENTLTGALVLDITNAKPGHGCIAIWQHEGSEIVINGTNNQVFPSNQLVWKTEKPNVDGEHILIFMFLKSKVYVSLFGGNSTNSNNTGGNTNTTDTTAPTVISDLVATDLNSDTTPPTDITDLIVTDLNV